MKDESPMIGDQLAAAAAATSDLRGNAAEWGSLVLDEHDPFEAVVIKMIQMNRRKRRDYALDDSPWSNFDFSADAMGIRSEDAAVFNVSQKLARLAALRANGRLDEPANEAVEDTYLDLAVYAVIALGIRTYPRGRVD